MIIEFPVRDSPHGYVQRHIDVRLDGRQARGLRAVLEGSGDARLRNGTRLKTVGDAIRWILEQVEAELPPDAPE